MWVLLWKTLLRDISDSALLVRHSVPSSRLFCLRSEESDAENLSSLRSSIFYCPAFPKFPGRTLHIGIHNKKGTPSGVPFSLISDFLSSQAVSSQVLSAFMSLTTVFEMGTGGSS